ncbi:MAG: TauD/TfdA family dioxygenase [Novosphingobium sp.]|nr:TauD/TfdA family dioxygenase [Novosphingobium sp.]
MKLERINPNIGARISGADVTQFTPDNREELLGLLDEHLVLFFTGQNVTPRQLLAFGRAVGEVQPPDEAAPYTPHLGGDLEQVQTIDVTGTARGTYADIYHSDVSFFECPTYAALLHPDVLPDIGGDTIWASMYAAYETLDAPVRAMIEDMRAIHQVAMPGNFMEHSHPLVRVNPRTGRRALYLNRLFTKRIEGLAPVESQNLLEMLFTHCTLPEFQTRFTWSPDIVVVWDNRFTLHYAVRDYTAPRRMFRTSTCGERPIGPSEYEAMREAVPA